METNLAELVLLAAAAYGLYRLLKPIQVWLERLILALLDPKARDLIDAEVVSETHKKRNP